MTDRPEPVKAAATLGGLVSAAVSAVGGAVLLVERHGDLSATATAVGAAVTAVTSLVAFAAPYVAALWARRRVTPVADPRDDSGPLVPADDPPGKHDPDYNGR